MGVVEVRFVIVVRATLITVLEQQRAHVYE
jgi:hypothetical protein